MTLVKRTAQEESPKEEMASMEQVTLSPGQRVMANVSTESVQRRDVVHGIDAVGFIDYAEPSRVKVAARFRGRIEKLYVNFTGEMVREGEPLFALYSPDLVSAQRDYALASAAAAVLREDAPPGEKQGAADMLSAARDRLRVHYGMTPRQIEAIVSKDGGGSMVTFYAPVRGTVVAKEVQEGEYVDEGRVLYELADNTRLWAYLDIYETELRFVKPGLPVTLSTDAYPGESFSGKVTFVDPAIDPQTRALRVRVELSGTSGKLKPQMYVRGEVRVPLVRSLVVPPSALLSTGRRNVVWVEIRPNTFEARDVHVGFREASGVQILHGLEEGEKVAVSGGFLLDSESQLRQPAEGGVQKGHVHD